MKKVKEVTTYLVECDSCKKEIKLKEWNKYTNEYICKLCLGKLEEPTKPDIFKNYTELEKYLYSVKSWEDKTSKKSKVNTWTLLEVEFLKLNIPYKEKILEITQQDHAMGLDDRLPAINKFLRLFE
ncbi:MAG: hypothetical protein KAS32_00240 [Candidatus Peribacteraceae bacterium]|nr:hypothetical protein [Candidatus Peribacteraceae bacterium]